MLISRRQIGLRQCPAKACARSSKIGAQLRCTTLCAPKRDRACWLNFGVVAERSASSVARDRELSNRRCTTVNEGKKGPPSLLSYFFGSERRTRCSLFVRVAGNAWLVMTERAILGMQACFVVPPIWLPSVAGE